MGSERSRIATLAVLLAALHVPAACQASFTTMVAGFRPGNPGAPSVASYTPSHGQVGDIVTINGAYFNGASVVTFNGTAAVFSVLDDTAILTTVPNGATTGAIAVTTAVGTGTGPSFTVDANAFAFNLDTATLPSGLTGSTTGGTVYCARSNGTTAVAVTGSDIYEQRDDIFGQWTFPAYTNVVADPTDFSGWTNNVTVMTTGQADPVGGSAATKLRDNSAVTVASIYSPNVGGNGYDPTASIWVRDDVSDPPTASGVVTASDGGGGFPMGYCGILTCQDLGSGVGWRRRHSKIGTSGASGPPQILLSPAGQTPLFNSYATQSASATGSRIVWGASAISGSAANVSTFDAPTTFGSRTARCIAVDGGRLGDILDVNGDFDVEGAFFLPDIFSSQTLTSMNIATMETAEGITSLFLDTSIAWYGMWKGGTPAGSSISYGRNGQLLKWRYLFKPSENIYGWSARLGGAIAWVEAHASPSGSLSTPTSFHLGCDESGGHALPALHVLLRRSGRSASTLYDAEGVVLGDSTMAAYSGVYVLVASLIYNATEALTRLGILSVATTGDRCDQQLTKWQASTARGNADVAWVSTQCGINDIGQGASAATTITRIQNIVNDINSNNPGAAVILVPMIQAKQLGFDSGMVTNWNAVNTAIEGGGGTPITGSNIIRMPLWTSLQDPGDHDSLLPAYQTGDGHDNDDARAIMGAAYRAALVANGLL